MSTPQLMPQRTVYFSLAMQIYMNETIKKPALKAVSILFDNESSKIQKFKAVKMLWNAFEATKGLPEPTKENTWHPNTHNLIDLRDHLFERCHLNIMRMGFIRRVMDFVIILIDFDPPWRWIFDSVREEAMNMEWKPRGWNDTWKGTYVWWKENGT